MVHIFAKNVTTYEMKYHIFIFVKKVHIFYTGCPCVSEYMFM